LREREGRKDWWMTEKSTTGRETYNIIYMHACNGRAAHAGVFYPKFSWLWALVESACKPTIHDVSTTGRVTANENGQKCKKEEVLPSGSCSRRARCTLLQLTWTSLGGNPVCWLIVGHGPSGAQGWSMVVDVRLWGHGWTGRLKTCG
jgi:hypothetical protein